MTEYIKREDMISGIDKAFKLFEEHDDIIRLFSDVRSCAIYTKAADVVPVRHGRWIPISNGDGAECSKCGGYFDVSDEAGMAAFKMFCVAYKFCPNCGTLMDLEGE